MSSTEWGPSIECSGQANIDAASGWGLQQVVAELTSGTLWSVPAGVTTVAAYAFHDSFSCFSGC